MKKLVLLISLLLVPALVFSATTKPEGIKLQLPVTTVTITGPDGKVIHQNYLIGLFYDSKSNDLIVHLKNPMKVSVTVEVNGR